MYDKIMRFVDAIYYILEKIAFILFAAMVLVTVAQVASRHLLPISLPWTEETARVLLISVTLLGAAVMAKKQMHIRMDQIIAKIPRKWLPFSWITIFVLNFIFLGPAIWGSYLNVLQTWGTRTATIPFLRTGHVYLVVLVGLTLIAVAIIIEVVNNFRNHRQNI